MSYKDDINDCFWLVNEFFKGDFDKTELWFDTENPLLGNVTPRSMAVFGRHKKLLQFIKSNIEGNYP